MSEHFFKRRGIIFVVSAPSGTGKSTLCRTLRETPDFVYSTSATTRKPRSGEEDGVDYFFHSREEFMKKADAGEFLEWAEVHGNLYGTPLNQVLELTGKGKDVLLEIDVQGARAIRQVPNVLIQESLVDVFIMPPTMKELEKRLRKRGTESEEDIRLRLSNAKKEMPLWKDYKYTILSGAMEEDLMKFRAIMRAERYLSARLELKHDFD